MKKFKFIGKNFYKIATLCIITILLLCQVCLAKEIEKTFYCSYIVGGTDVYFKLDPITLKSNGHLIMNNKLIGIIVDVSAENGELFAGLSGGATWSLEIKRMLSIYTKPLGDEVVYSFGSCVMKNNN